MPVYRAGLGRSLPGPLDSRACPRVRARPLSVSHRVREASDPKSVGLSAEDHAKYRELVGAMLYCSTVCRPDIAVAVGLLSLTWQKCISFVESTTCCTCTLL